MVSSFTVEGARVVFEGLVAVNDVNLTLSEGEIVGLIGPNGAGKTTLINVMSGFRHPDAGAAWVLGHQVRRWSPQARGG